MMRSRELPVSGFARVLEAAHGLLGKVTVVVVPVTVNFTRPLEVMLVVFALLCADLLVRYLDRRCARQTRAQGRDLPARPVESEAAKALALALGRPARPAASEPARTLVCALGRPVRPAEPIDNRGGYSMPWEEEA
jgi:hypothetical protein